MLQSNRNTSGKKSAFRVDLCWTLTHTFLSKKDCLRQNFSDSDLVRDQQLRGIWEIDSLAREIQTTILSYAKSRKVKTMAWDRYEVAIPWKKKFPSLSQNIEEAQKRMFALERNLHKKPEVARCYKDAMKANVK